MRHRTDKNKNALIGLLVLASLAVIVWATAVYFNFAVFWQRPLLQLRAGDVVVLVGLLLLIRRLVNWSPKQEV